MEDTLPRRPGRKKGTVSRSPAEVMRDLESQIADLRSKYETRVSKLESRLAKVKQKMAVERILDRDLKSLEGMSQAELLEHTRALAELLSHRKKLKA